MDSLLQSIETIQIEILKDLDKRRKEEEGANVSMVFDIHLDFTISGLVRQSHRFRC